MPKRPRQHQLESESRAAIRSAIPSLWVYRDLDQDYGIDSEVEIFGASGSATGAKFLVQLKATDQPDVRRALRLWFRRSIGEYYSSLDLPVLIVRYHAPSKLLYARWFHSLDPYYGKRKSAGISFQLGEQDAWTDSTPDRLVVELEAFREIRSTRLRRPLTFSLRIEGDEVSGIPRYRLLIALQEASRQAPGLISFQTNLPSKTPLAHALSVSNEKIEVIIGGTHGFTLHTPRGCDAGTTDTTLSHDIMLCVGLAFDGRGHPLEGASLIALFWKGSLCRDMLFAFRLGSCMARANQMDRALEIAEELFRDKSAVNAAQFLLMPILTNRAGMSISERDFTARILDRIASEVEHRGAFTLASQLNYNCANLLRGMNRYREAVRYYRKAARLDGGYLRRGYYWRELAGILFLVRRFALAAKLYKRSLELEDHRLTRALHADALMFSGQYRAAEAAFDNYLTSPVNPEDSEWALKSLALSWLRSETGLDEQRRKAPTFPDPFHPQDLDEGEIQRACREALGADALSALAWFNLGQLRHKQGDTEAAAKCFLLAALIVPQDLEAWGNVISISQQTQKTHIFCYAFYVAYWFNGEDLLRHLAERVPDRPEEFLSSLTKLTDLVHASKPKMVMRIHGQDGIWDQVTADGKTGARDKY